MVLYVPHELADEFEQTGRELWHGRGTIVGWDQPAWSPAGQARTAPVSVAVCLQPGRADRGDGVVLNPPIAV